jgi:prolyl 4-hydroxylase
MAIDLIDLIQVYDNVLDNDICNILINLFESSDQKHKRIDNDGKPNFTEYNLTDNHKESSQIEQIHNFIISKVFEYKEKYYEFVDNRVFPENHNFEHFKIKKYENNGIDKFETHVDVTDYDSSKRFLSFFWYLNDVTEGGETVFNDLTITPKSGKLVIFPPLWMFPHKGNPPISNEKYLLSTYLHYF